MVYWPTRVSASGAMEMACNMEGEPNEIEVYVHDLLVL